MNQSYIRQIKIESIQGNPWNTRQADPDPAYIKDLALDIAAHGLLQIPIGRMLDEKGQPAGAVQIEAHGGEAAYLTDNPGAVVQLAFGHNRLAAYKLLSSEFNKNTYLRPEECSQFDTMPVDVRALTDEQMAVYSWSENEKRRDVTAIERARAIKNRLDSFKWSNRECAEALGVDHSTISNLLRLLKLPEDLQQAILNSDISERQAMAILPVYEAPTAVVDAQAGYYSYSSNSDVIKRAALAGESSDRLRKQVEEYFDYRSTDLAQAEFKLDQLFPEGEGVYCGLCKTCDRRMASRNRCFDKECFSAKENYIHREYLKKASHASGYGILDEHKGGYPSHLPSDEEKFERILATKCPNLVLAYSHGETTHSIPGHPHAMLVCEKRNDSCSCVKGLKMLSNLGSGQPAKPLTQVFDEERTGVSFQEGDNDDYDADEAREDLNEDDDTGQADAVQIPATLSAMELEDAARQARKDKRTVGDRMSEIRTQLEDHLFQELAVNEATGVLFVVAHGSVWPYGSDLDRDALYHYMARKAAGTIIPSTAESLDDLLKNINRHLANLKLEALVIEEAEAV